MRLPHYALLVFLSVMLTSYVLERERELDAQPQLPGFCAQFTHHPDCPK